MILQYDNSFPGFFLYFFMFLISSSLLSFHWSQLLNRNNTESDRATRKLSKFYSLEFIQLLTFMQLAIHSVAKGVLVCDPGFNANNKHSCHWPWAGHVTISLLNIDSCDCGAKMILCSNWQNHKL